MRLRLKRNRHYRDYRGCVRGGLELLQQQQQQARPAIPEADLSIRIKSLSLSEQEEGDIPLDEEPSPKEEIVVSGEEKTIFRCACELISPMLVTHGTFELTSRAVYFIIDVEATSASSESRPSLANLAVHTKKEKSRRWALDSIKDVHTRRYLLRNSALEFFFADHTTAFFNYDRKTNSSALKEAHVPAAALSGAVPFDWLAGDLDGHSESGGAPQAPEPDGALATTRALEL